MRTKIEFIESAPVGTIVAFIDDSGKTRSAAIVERDQDAKTLKLVTEFEREYNVAYDKVIWVKSGSRWPKGVYEMLKGKVKNDSEKSN